MNLQMDNQWHSKDSSSLADNNDVSWETVNMINHMLGSVTADNYTNIKQWKIFTCNSGCPGNSEQVWPSGPIPSTRTSNRGVSSSGRIKCICFRYSSAADST